MKKGFSIVVCCYNSVGRIEKTFQYIKRLKTDSFDFEVIIIDNNSSDNTYDIAVAIRKENRDMNVIVVRERRSGKSNALITGIEKAVYENIVVCDDDNWLNHDYLIVANQRLANDQLIGVIGGRGVLHSDINPSSWFTKLENSWAVGQQAKNSGEIANEPPAVWGAGMVLRKTAWDLMFEKGFTTFLTGRKRERVSMAGEDTEACILIHALGYKIVYEDRMWYNHNVPSNRLTWKSLKELWEGFSRSSVYFDMYNYYFYHQRCTSSPIRKKFNHEIISNLKGFFRSSSIINFIKVMYIAFIEDRPGYLTGLEKRRFLFRMKELWRIRNTYADHFKIISNFQPWNHNNKN